MDRAHLLFMKTLLTLTALLAGLPAIWYDGAKAYQKREKTDDGRNITLAIIVAVISLLGISILSFKKIKNKNK